MASMSMTNSVFPDEIMISILTRLPVKSILRFKSVCKPWFHLLSTPHFRKLHQAQFSSDPKNHALILHRSFKNSSYIFSLFNLHSDERRPTIIDHPFSHEQMAMSVVGCCNGLVCISSPPLCPVIHLWNPAMKLSKEFKPLKACGANEFVSLGFGYDAAGDDFKVVRVLCLEDRREARSTNVTAVEVYSVNLDSWTTIEMTFQFSMSRHKSEVIVNGNPYWIAEAASIDVLVRFDVTKLVFEIVSLSTLLTEKGDKGIFDWNGCLGALICTTQNERVGSVNIWVFDDGERIWRKNHTIGPIEVNMCRFLHCSRYGKIVVERRDGKLFVFDPQAGHLKPLFHGGRNNQTFETHGYIESLAYSAGMKQVGSRKRSRTMVGDAN